MADQKVSALTELTVSPDPTDEIEIVDKSDTSMAASGTNKRLQYSNLAPQYGFAGFSTPPTCTAIASVATGATNQFYAAPVFVLSQWTITGIRYRVGATSNGNVRSALYTGATGAKVADRTTDVAQAAATAQQAVLFTASYVASPGLYYALIWFSSATATYVGGRQLSWVATGTNATVVPTSISAAVATAVDYPVMVTI